MNNEIIDYFKNGLLYKVSTNDMDSYNATVFVADGIRYYLLNKEDVKKLPMPLFNSNKGAFPETVKSEDYILRMVAGNIRKNNKDIGLLLMAKAVEMMEISPIEWLKRDYLRFAKYLYEDGLFEEGNKFEKWVESSHPDPVLITSEDTKKKDIAFVIDKQFYYLKYKHPDAAPKSKSALLKLYYHDKEEYLKYAAYLPNEYKLND